ncbi:hypothetical protein [Nocardioides korecus]
MFFTEEDAATAVARLRRDGFDAAYERQAFAGEDDDEDHPWVVVTDAPEVMLELLVEQHDGWLEPDPGPPPTAPFTLPSAPKRRHRP